MTNGKPRALVLAGFGINCDYETAHVLALAGAEARRVHVSQLTGAPNHSPPHKLADYQILVLDGGFAWGDDHGAGVLLAIRLANHLGDDLRAFLDKGGVVLGICNGFQALVNLGLLPGLKGTWERSVALMANDCGNFQDRWVSLLAEKQSPCVFTRGINLVDMPVRHGEGKLVADEATIARLKDLGCVALRYARGNKPAAGKFPANPNGSINDIAGICDPSGRILGLMPHPEAFYRASQHPLWLHQREAARRKGGDLDPFAPGGGMIIFENAVAAAQEID